MQNFEQDTPRQGEQIDANTEPPETYYVWRSQDKSLDSGWLIERRYKGPDGFDR